MSEKRYPVTFNNSPGPTFFSVRDHENRIIHRGVTPQLVKLDASSGPYRPAKYSVVFAGRDSASQKRALRAGFDPWGIGNILIGGVIGWVIDGANGSMFKLPEQVAGNVPSQHTVTDPDAGIAMTTARH